MTALEIREYRPGHVRPLSVPKTLENIQADLESWHLAIWDTVGTPEQLRSKVWEEVGEFMTATNDGDAAMEAADIIIALVGWFTATDQDAGAAVADKLRIIFDRKFVRLPDGRTIREDKL